MSHLGDIVLFAEMVLAKFRVCFLTSEYDCSLTFSVKISSPIIKDGKMYRTELLRCTSRVYQLDDLSPEHKSAFATWYKAIFDSNSEGIDDALLRYCVSALAMEVMFHFPVVQRNPKFSCKSPPHYSRRLPWLARKTDWTTTRCRPVCHTSLDRCSGGHSLA